MIMGKNIGLRLVDVDDAAFIVEMRSDKDKSIYLSHVESNVEKQKGWIREYKKRESKKEEYYFIIESRDDEKLGLVRLYDFKESSFCWGSWLIKKGAPKTTAIESALQIYDLAFYKLGFKQSHFDVRKENERVNAFHQRFGALIIDEDELNYYYKYTEKTYKQVRKKYKRFSP